MKAETARNPMIFTEQAAVERAAVSLWLFTKKIAVATFFVHL
jgi:hypothetical protein